MNEKERNRAMFEDLSNEQLLERAKNFTGLGVTHPHLAGYSEMVRELALRLYHEDTRTTACQDAITKAEWWDFAEANPKVVADWLYLVVRNELNLTGLRHLVNIER